MSHCVFSTLSPRKRVTLQEELIIRYLYACKADESSEESIENMETVRVNLGLIIFHLSYIVHIQSTFAIHDNSSGHDRSCTSFEAK